MIGREVVGCVMGLEGTVGMENCDLTEESWGMNTSLREGSLLEGS